MTLCLLAGREQTQCLDISRCASQASTSKVSPHVCEVAQHVLRLVCLVCHGRKGMKKKSTASQDRATRLRWARNRETLALSICARLTLSGRPRFICVLGSSVLPLSGSFRERRSTENPEMVKGLHRSCVISLGWSSKTTSLTETCSPPVQHSCPTVNRPEETGTHHMLKAPMMMMMNHLSDGGQLLRSGLNLASDLPGHHHIT